MRQFYQDEKRCRYAFEREIEDKMKFMLEKSEREIKDQMKTKLENLEIEHRSVENDLRAQIAQQKTKIMRLEKFDEEKNEKIVKLQKKIVTMKAQFKDVRTELVQRNQREKTEYEKKTSQKEKVALFENCMIFPDSNRFHLHADVAPFLRALEAGLDNLNFRINYLSPFNKEKGWNTAQHFFKTVLGGSTYFYPKTIHHDSDPLITGNYGLRTSIADERSKHIYFGLFTPLNAKLKITANVESDSNFKTQRWIRDVATHGKLCQICFFGMIEIPQHHSFLNGASISITWNVSHEK